MVRKRISNSDAKKMSLRGDVKPVGKPPPPPAKPGPPAAPAPDHSDVLITMAELLKASSTHQARLLEEMKALMTREPGLADLLRQLIAALEKVQAPKPAAPWQNLRFQIERDGAGNMLAVNVTRDPQNRRLN